MIWLSLFAISIAQGVFLVSLVILKRLRNLLAAKLIAAMILIMILTNLGYLVIRTDLVHYLPQLFAVPLGMTFLFGPLFYFYSKSVVDPSFRWKIIYWIHFIPYLIQLIMNFPFFTADAQSWNWFLSSFLSGQLAIRLTEKIMFALQIAQLSAYLIFAIAWINNLQKKDAPHFIVPIVSRINWLKSLLACFVLFLLTVIGAYIFVLYNGRYYPPTNYLYTLTTSLIIYFTAYRFVLHPELVNPDFSKKYQAYMSFAGDAGNKYLDKLKALMNDNKLYTDPELKLATVAKDLELPPHQLSKLINEKLGKSFSDLINEYRVQEFLEKLSRDKHASYTFYGLALDVGFNSKSSFNTAFKKVTGKTPTEYKSAL